MQTIFQLLLFFIIFIPLQAQELEKVKLQLQWKYQFQFAGFLVAKERGFYKDVGLDVDILEYHNTNSMQELMDGKIDYAINNSIIVYKDKKLQDVTLLATYFQRSPLVIIAQPEIKSAQGLMGKTIMMSKNNLYNSSLSTLLDYFSINTKNTHFIAPSFNINDFISKKVDAITAFKSNEVFELNQKKVPYNIIDPVEYGFSTNAINLFSSYKKVKNNPEQIKRFLSATKKGWVYALKHIDATAHMIHQKYQKKKSFALLQYEGHVTKQLMLPNMYEVGEINEAFITKTYKQLLLANKLEKNQDKSHLFFKEQSTKQTNALQLTQKEKKWILAHPVVTYSEVNWKPLSIIKDGNMDGIMGDYLKYISKKAGLTFKYIPASSWPDVLKKFRKKEIDMVPGIGSSPQETAFGLVSQTYSKYPMAIVTDNRYSFLDSLKAFQGKSIAVPKHYTSYNFIKNRYPEIKVIPTDSIEEALLQVASKRADAFVGHLATSLYYLAKLNLNQLKISGTTSFQFEHHYLVQHKYPELLSIINKTLKAMSQKEKDTIKANWIHTKMEQKLETSTIVEILGVVLILTLFFSYRQFLLQRHNKVLRDLQERIDLALTSSDSGVWDWDLVDNSVYLSPQWKKMLGYDENELPNKLSTWKERVHPEDIQRVIKEITLAQQNKIPYKEMTYRLRKKDGSYIWILSKSTTHYDTHHKPLRTVGIHIDITQRKLDEEKLLEQKSLLDYQAHHDALTNLPNRILFNDRLTQAIQGAKRERSKVALLFIDLDHFKKINDSLGHEVGDQVLIEVSQRLKKNIRAIDTLSRLGGDEFTVVVGDLKNAQDASILAKKMLETLSQPLLIDKHTLDISTSIGISLYPDDGDSCENLLKYSDAAMYKAKDEGRNNFQFYSSEMTQLAFQRVIMETNLREALQKEEFVVYYQPQVDGKSGTIIGMEALVRWQHPTMGFLSPDVFLPVARESGLLLKIDNFVMKTAMQQLSQWYQNGLQPGVLALNLSVKQLEKKAFIPSLKKMLEETKVQTQWLELEVTEGQIMLNPQKAITILQEISNLGIELAVDDFGTGYSSLSYLKKLPINKLKIDKSFVDGLPYDEEDIAISKAIIALAKSLNLKIIAEGVEEKEQKEFLVKNGCQYIQGYYYHKPMDAKSIENILRNQ